MDAGGKIELVNALGIDLGNDPETMLRRLESGEFSREKPLAADAACCSAHDYVARVSEIDQPTPSRFNANPEYLHEASGSAGRVIVFALRLDTFPKARDARVMHIATDSAEVLSDLRRHMLKGQACVPISGEYLSREVFDLASRYGRDTFLAVRYLGTHRLPAMFRAKRWVARIVGAVNRNARHVSDRLSQWMAGLLPGHLSKELKSVGRQYAHHLVLKVDAEQVAFVRDYVSSAPFAADVYVRECSADQGRDLLLHRFAAAGAAMRYAVLNEDRLGELLALDVALPRNDANWQELVPAGLREQVAGEFLYGHFFCHVFHLDLVLKQGVDTAAFKHAMLDAFNARGAECPAEHNVGHLYEAKPALRDFYRQLDPSNTLNPGIGMTSRNAGWE